MELSSSLHARASWGRRSSSLFPSCDRETGVPPAFIRIKTDANLSFCCSGYSQWKKLSLKLNGNLVTKTRATADKSNQPTTQIPIDQDDAEQKKKKQGTILGAMALIIGTSIGSGILAIPQKTASAGFVPSAIAMISCWGFLLMEALLLAEINVFLLKKKKRKTDTIKKGDLEIISIGTMAQETLGDWGATLVMVNYVFLGYTTMVAYTSKSGEIINHLSNIPSNISGFFFALFFSILICIGGTRTSDQVNQWLTIIMIVLLLAIEGVAAASGEWLGVGLDGGGTWAKVPATLPVIIFTLVYHDLIPVICAYLGGDLARIRVSFILGSLVPLLVLLVWDAVALGLSVHADQAVDPVEFLMRVRGGELSTMVEAFSLLAVGTSLLGTLLGFSQFFLEQLNKMSGVYSSRPIEADEGNTEASFSGNDRRLFGLGEWWCSNKFSVAATSLAVVPPLLISTTIPDVFSAATDIAGGYCMTMLYGVLPPTLAWEIRKSSSVNNGSKIGVVEEKDNNMDDVDTTLTLMRPAIFGLGVISCFVVLEQILLNL